MRGGGVQAVVFVEVQGLLHVGHSEVVVGRLGYGRRRWRRGRSPGGRGLRGTGSRRFRRRCGRRLRRPWWPWAPGAVGAVVAVGAGVAVGSPPQATAKTAKETRDKSRNNPVRPAGIMRRAGPIRFALVLSLRVVCIAINSVPVCAKNLTTKLPRFSMTGARAGRTIAESHPCRPERSEGSLRQGQDSSPSAGLRVRTTDCNSDFVIVVLGQVR